MNPGILFLKIFGSIFTVFFGITLASLPRTADRPNILAESMIIFFMVIILCSIWV